MAFQGSLAELQLPDIIQLVSVSGKTGVFHLVDGRRRGQIWLHEGRIVHAETEDSSAEEAVYALAIWRTGEFRFEPGIAAPRHTIQKSNTGLLMEAARRLDEWRVLSKKIPSVDLVPEFVILDNREGQINLNTMEWLLLSKIDGQRTVKQIASASGMGVFDAAKLLYGLVATNLIRLREPTPPPTSSPGTPARGTVTATVVRATPVPEPPGTPARGTAAPANAPLLAQLTRVHDECVALLGPVGETVVQKHYNRARAEIERGAGPEAIDEAVQQIARAAGILKGGAVAEAVMRLSKG
ncbi:MAG TPA: DUF4388 domain-containing protein [Vicinamibacteria bacterium]|nr:DUF4388 domain-containing protein [Vicinamibacteria bacterium]